VRFGSAERKEVDINANLTSLAPGVQQIAAQRTRFIQLTDGCTGNCGFCGLDVIRNISTQFSSAPLEQYLVRNAPNFKNGLALYWASDPLDWRTQQTNGTSPKDFAELVKSFIPHLGPTTLYTSTVVPKGTEEVFYSLFNVLYDDCLTSEKAHIVRVSVNERNRDFFLKAHLRYEDPTQRQFVRGMLDRFKEDRTVFRHQGRGFDHPKRNHLGIDSYPIACEDGLLLTPSGLFAIGFESATSGNRFGYWREEVKRTSSGTVLLPRNVHTSEYMYDRVQRDVYQLGYATLLPPVILDEINATGRIVGSVVRPSFRREALAFQKLAIALNTIINDVPLMIQNQRQFVSGTLAVIANRQREAEEIRKSEAVADPEAVDILNTFSLLSKEFVKTVAWQSVQTGRR
jgi:hypothetical protein